MLQTKVAEKIKTYILNSISFFFENRAVCDNAGGDCRAGKVTWQYGAYTLRAENIRLQTLSLSIHKVTDTPSQYIRLQTLSLNTYGYRHSLSIHKVTDTLSQYIRLQILSLNT
jgi:hypothetical protein